MQLHHEGHALKDMHVLYRAHYQSLELQMELNAMGVPFVITSGHKFFDLAHVKDILAHLRFVHNPLDQVALSRLLCLLPKVGPVAAEKISKAARETDEVQGRGLVRALRADAVLKRVPESAKDDFNDLTITLEDMLEGLEAAKAKPAPTGPAPDLFVAASDANSIKVARTPAETVRVCIEGWYGGFLKTIFPDWKDREQDLQGLIGFASKFEDVGDLVAQVALLNGESSDKKAEPEEDMLRLTTIHQSKGLEFPMVCCPMLWKGSRRQEPYRTWWDDAAHTRVVDVAAKSRWGSKAEQSERADAAAESAFSGSGEAICELPIRLMPSAPTYMMATESGLTLRTPHGR